MKRSSFLAAACLVAAVWSDAMMYAQTAASRPAYSSSKSAQPLHIASCFHFELHATMTEAAPFFGPEGERSWAGDGWDPKFLYPVPGSKPMDVEGAVFTVERDHTKAVWVNTIFDLGGRMQYVAVIPGHMVSVIDVRLTASGPALTRVAVCYTRTALDPRRMIL